MILLQNLRPEAQYRLRCTFSGPQDLGKGSALAGQQQMGANDVKLQKQIESLTRKVCALNFLKVRDSGIETK